MAKDYWNQPLPHHEGIIIWGPEDHNPQWHNEGDRDSRGYLQQLRH